MPLVYTITIANQRLSHHGVGPRPFRYSPAQHHARLYGSDRRRWRRVGLWRWDHSERPVERSPPRRPRRRVAGAGESTPGHRRVHLARDGCHECGRLERLRWTPWRPYGKELPNNRQAETAYALGNANMLGNDVLLHLNESAGATTFTDTSGLGHNGACPASVGETCPTAGASGASTARSTLTAR